MPRPDLPKKGRHAVVLGGGIAGLASAGVLARHFDAVTVVERDRYDAAPSVRPHSPQGQHVHALLTGGLAALTRLVPELPEWLDAMGLIEGDLTYHLRVAYAGQWLPRARSGLPVRGCTRADLEHLLLRDVRRRPNVTVLEGCRTVGFIGRGHIRGVRTTLDDSAHELRADLVVDAQGRSSPTAAWLVDTGLARVEEELVDPGVVYASGWFEPPRSIDDDWVALATLPAIPSDPRIVVVVRFPDGRMHCSSIEYGGPTPPRSAAELVQRMGLVSVPELQQLLAASRPLSPLSTYANTQNRLRKFSRLPGFPEGLVVLGDATCSLNPRYGQGMTVASLSVEHLHVQLGAFYSDYGHLTGFGPWFQASLEKLIAAPWQAALMEDRSWVTHFAGGRPALGQRFALGATERILKTAFSDLDTYVRFMRVAHMLDAPSKMLVPRTVGAVVRGRGPGPALEVEPPRVVPNELVVACGAA